MKEQKPIVSVLDMSVYQMVSLRPNKLFPDPMNNDCVIKLRLTSTLSIACWAALSRARSEIRF